MACSRRCAPAINSEISAVSGMLRQNFFGISLHMAPIFSRAGLKMARELNHVRNGEPRTPHVGTLAIDAIMAIEEAAIGQQDFEQGNAASVRRIAVANAHALG